MVTEHVIASNRSNLQVGRDSLSSFHSYAIVQSEPSRNNGYNNSIKEVAGVELTFFLDVLLEAFRLIFSFDPEIYFIVWTSLKVSAFATFFASILGVPLGLVIALNQFRGKPAILLILNSLMALPTVVIGLIGYFLLTRRGLLGSLSLLYTPAGIALGLFVSGAPYDNKSDARSHTES